MSDTEEGGITEEASNIIVGATVVSVIVGVFIGIFGIYFYKACRKKRDHLDIENVATTSQAHRTPEHMDVWVPGAPGEVCPRCGSAGEDTQTDRARESGIYSRISKFDYIVETMEVCTQTGEPEVDYVYLIRSEQGVQCDIITQPAPSIRNQSALGHRGGTAYSDDMKKVFKSWGILPEGAMLSSACTIAHNSGYQTGETALTAGKSAQLASHLEEHGTAIRTGQREQPPLHEGQHGYPKKDSGLKQFGNSYLVIKVTEDVRKFLGENGLCRNQPTASVPSNQKAALKYTKITHNSSGHTTMGGSEEVYLTAGNQDEDYLLMGGMEADYLLMGGMEEDEFPLGGMEEDYLPMGNQEKHSLPMRKKPESSEEKAGGLNNTEYHSRSIQGKNGQLDNEDYYNVGNLTKACHSVIDEDEYLPVENPDESYEDCLSVSTDKLTLKGKSGQ